MEARTGTSSSAEIEGVASSREEKAERLASFAVFDTTIFGTHEHSKDQNESSGWDMPVVIVNQGAAVRGRQFYPENEILF